MEKGRKKIRFCVLFVVLAAIVVGMVYYYGQYQEESVINRGTLIAKTGMELEKLCR